MYPFNTLPCKTANTQRWLMAVAWSGLLGAPALAQPVKCHLEYAGVTRAITVMPTACPAGIQPQVEGSSLVFKVINAAPPAQERGVTIETQTLQNDALQTTHQAHYLAWEASPTSAGMPYGFTGLQTVLNSGPAQNLRYWCERLAPTPFLAETTCPETSR